MVRSEVSPTPTPAEVSMPSSRCVDDTDLADYSPRPRDLTGNGGGQFNPRTL